MDYKIFDYVFSQKNKDFFYHVEQPEKYNRMTRNCVCAKSLQWVPTLYDLVDSSQAGSSVHGILQARILGWGVAGVLCPFPGDIPNPGIRPVFLMSLALAAGFFTTSITWKAPKRNQI